ncbi:hypothetical protein C5167_037917 [Papaver somniferum]|uniref:nucleoside-diphosphate kinase n=1 Tax=Papaver somniferum TaxID=3469 RepID=A0A4Y7IBT4_PAPSO|nr:hypothetical protein C5167_037917 [Papaver somniferum]
MEEFSKRQKTEERMIDQKLEKTFVLAYPIYFHHSCFGRLLAQFEEPGLKITEMRCMNVGEGFALEHFCNIDQKLEQKTDFVDRRFRGWIEYITSGPVVAMIVEGDNSVDRVDELMTFSDKYPFGVSRTTVYASKTVEQAQRDIKLWFRQVKFEIPKSTKDVFILPTGEIYGPEEELKEVLLKSYNYKLIQFNPCTVWFFERNGRCDGYAVAVVAVVKPRLTIKPGITERIIGLGYNDEYLQKIEQGEGPQGVLEAAKEFFEYGFSVRGYPRDNSRSFGCMFEASLVGHE